MIYEEIKFCPICGYKFTRNDFDKSLIMHKCQECGFKYFHNMIPTTSCIVPKKGNPGEILLMTRNMQPGKGKVDLPGGFLQYGETPEEGIRREIREELGIELKPRKLLGIKVNEYKFEGHKYKHTTIYFLTEPVATLPKIADKHENSSVRFFDLRNIEKERKNFAFKGDWEIVREWKEEHKKTTK